MFVETDDPANPFGTLTRPLLMPVSGFMLLVDGDAAVHRLLSDLIRVWRPGHRLQTVSDAVGLAEIFHAHSWTELVMDPATCPWVDPVRLAEAMLKLQRDCRLVVWSAGLSATTTAALARCGAHMLERKDFAGLGRLPHVLGWTAQTAASSEPSGPSEPWRAVPDQEAPGPWRLASDDVLPPLRSLSVPRTQPDSTRSASPDHDAAAPAELVHDLKEPLRAMEQLLRRCEMRHREILPQEAKTLIQSARRSAQQLSEQIEESMTLLPGPSQAHCDANRGLSEALQHVEVLRAETGARVTTDPLPTLAVPASGIRRVFENLLVNAMRYRGAEAPEIHVSAQSLDEEAIISVADNGRGIDEALHDQLFEAGAKGPDGGAGIGLSSARRVVERWGGEIWFDTVTGEGSTFFFSAPLASSGTRPASSQKAEQKI